MRKLIWIVWSLLAAASIAFTVCYLIWKSDWMFVYGYLSLILWHWADNDLQKHIQLSGIDNDTNINATRLLNEYAQVIDLLKEWSGHKGHASCWYYPELFNKMLTITGLPSANQPTVTLEQFQAGCKKYQSELYPSANHWVNRDCIPMIPIADHNIKMNQMRDACLEHMTTFLSHHASDRPTLSADCRLFVQFRLYSASSKPPSPNQTAPASSQNQPASSSKTIPANQPASSSKYPMALAKETPVEVKRQILRKEDDSEYKIVQA